MNVLMTRYFWTPSSALENLRIPVSLLLPSLLMFARNLGASPRKKVIRIRIKVVKVSMEASCPMTPVERATMRWLLRRSGISCSIWSARLFQSLSIRNARNSWTFSNSRG